MLSIAPILDHIVAAVDAARAAAGSDTRWLNALDKAYDWLIQQDAVDFDADSGELTLTSPNSGNTYTANGACQCEAYDSGIAFEGTPFACWHRAAARILKNAIKRQSYIDQAAVVADAISELDAEGGHYEGADVSERTRALNARIAAARGAVASVQAQSVQAQSAKRVRSAAYLKAEADLLECF